VAKENSENRELLQDCQECADCACFREDCTKHRKMYHLLMLYINELVSAVEKLTTVEEIKDQVKYLDQNRQKIEEDESARDTLHELYASFSEQKNDG